MLFFTCRTSDGVCSSRVWRGSHHCECAGLPDVSPGESGCSAWGKCVCACMFLNHQSVVTHPHTHFSFLLAALHQPGFISFKAEEEEVCVFVCVVVFCHRRHAIRPPHLIGCYRQRLTTRKNKLKTLEFPESRRSSEGAERS